MGRKSTKAPYLLSKRSQRRNIVKKVASILKKSPITLRKQDPLNSPTEHRSFERIAENEAIQDTVEDHSDCLSNLGK